MSFFVCLGSNNQPNEEVILGISTRQICNIETGRFHRCWKAAEVQSGWLSLGYPGEQHERLLKGIAFRRVCWCHRQTCHGHPDDLNSGASNCLGSKGLPPVLMLLHCAGFDFLLEFKGILLTQRLSWVVDLPGIWPSDTTWVVEIEVVQRTQSSFRGSCLPYLFRI